MHGVISLPDATSYDKKTLCNATNRRLPVERNTESNLGFIFVNDHLQLGGHYAVLV